MRTFNDSLPTRASMRAGLKVRKMRKSNAEHRHLRIVRTQAKRASVGSTSEVG